MVMFTHSVMIYITIIMLCKDIGVNIEVNIEQVKSQVNEVVMTANHYLLIVIAIIFVYYTYRLMYTDY